MNLRLVKHAQVIQLLTFIVLVVKEIFDVGFSKRMNLINFLLFEKGVLAVTYLSRRVIYISY